MIFNIHQSITNVIQDPIVGNVYNVRGGTGARQGHMQVIVSIVSNTCVTLTLGKDGSIIGSSNYALHYFTDKTPMAYCPNLETMTFDVLPIG